MTKRKFKIIFLIGMISILLFVFLVIGTMCGSNQIMTGSELYRLEQIANSNIKNTLIQIKKDETQEQEANKKWEVVVGQDLQVQQLSNNSLPAKYYKKLHFDLNNQYINKRINEIGLYLKAEKDITFTLGLTYGKGEENQHSSQTLSLKANEGVAVIFDVSQENISFLEFSNETEIKEIADIVKWTMYDIKVSFN